MKETEKLNNSAVTFTLREYMLKTMSINDMNKRYYLVLLGIEAYRYNLSSFSFSNRHLLMSTAMFRMASDAAETMGVAIIRDS